MKKWPVWLVPVCLCACVSALSCGTASFSFSDWLGIVRGEPGYEMQRVILLSVRLPRLLAALLAGCGLTLSGTILQTVTDNPLAGPNVIGVNAGAGLAAALCLWLTPALSAWLPLFAFLGAAMATGVIFALSARFGSRKSVVVLCGVACSALFQAGISFIVSLDSDVLSAYNAFSIGGFAGVKMSQMTIPALVIALCLALTLLFSKKLQILSLGDELAASLGVNVRRMRGAALLLASLSAAAVVSFAGLLGFVGLMVPHIARLIAGEGMKGRLNAGMLCGMALVTLSDTLGRVAFAPGEIPVGVIMAFLGAPFFFVLLIRGRA